jgi:hypothetical protein
MLQKPFLPAAKLFALPVGNRRWGIFPSDAVPEVFDELKTLSASELKQRRKFLVHAAEYIGIRGVVQPWSYCN